MSIDSEAELFVNPYCVKLSSSARAMRNLEKQAFITGLKRGLELAHYATDGCRGMVFSNPIFQQGHQLGVAACQQAIRAIEAPQPKAPPVDEL